jgi:membrane-associated phospholipid phosphatase
LIRPDVLNGVVTFPSFHAAAAILLGWGFWALRWIRWPAVALNIAMFLAAVPIGGHYVADILAGAAAAVLAIKVAVILDRGTLTRSAKSG